MTTIKILDKKCEYGMNPVGIDTMNPRFSWNIKAEKRGAGQKFYQIRVYDEKDACVWDTGKTESDERQYQIWERTEVGQDIMGATVWDKEMRSTNRAFILRRLY